MPIEQTDKTVKKDTQNNNKTKNVHSVETKLAHLGRNPDEYHGIVNPPITRTSTILFKDYDAYENRAKNLKAYRYGRMGTPISDAFEQTIADLENGFKAISFPSGIAAITSTILAVVKTGDHILMADSVYYPTRYFCDQDLKRFNIDVEYYDPFIGANIDKLIKPHTSLIFLESPGSGIFEVQDVPAIAKIAKQHNITTMIDNTWSTPLLFNPIDHGVNIVIHAATKYITGHSDVNMGVVVCDSPSIYRPIKSQAVNLGYCCSGDDLYTALRSIRTMKLRLDQSAQSALKIAKFLQTIDSVDEVFHPALPEHKNHDIWKRDYRGSNGLISFILKSDNKNEIAAFVDALELFPIGSSWGGYESLLQPQELDTFRTARLWKKAGKLLRIQIGLENVDDLIADLKNGFTAFNNAK